MDPFEVYAQYGIIGLLIMAVGILAVVIFKIDGRLRMIEKSDQNRDHHCDKQKENLGKAFDKIENLEQKDVAKSGRFETIENKLENIGDGLGRMETKLDKVINHYLEEGLKK